ncbi:MAG: SDR family NAD(P)-dependent oxidoreductase [Candidatus Bathyarchaeota archaeon]|nr:SDR family NAD(P)-dependent oxidoreductase [Candidatus Bathyarchaeota archaeon]
MNRLQGKTALITGAGSGIGRATAILFAAEGARVAVNDISEKGGQDTVRLIKQGKGEATFYKANVTKLPEVKAMVKQILDRYGRIDVLHNNVGGWQKENNDTVVNDSEEEWDRLINLNLRGVFLVSKEVVPLMIKGGGGSIINTITTNAYMNYVGNHAYGTSKGGLRELTRSMCLDYAKHSIRVNGLVPGETVTPQWTASIEAAPNPEETKSFLIKKIPMGRFAQPEDIAKGALFLASDESCYVNGHILFVDGGLTAGFYG